MTISIWRYSHLVLAIASSLFLLIASITGVILAVEPISHQAKGYAVQDLENVSLGTAIATLRSQYDEVFELEVESSGFVKASVLTTEMETLEIYVNPRTGEQLGDVQERAEIYSFATNLHRSLFLKSVGRFFVGLIALLLFLITVTGLLLLAKRQGGFKRLFSKVQKDYFELRYHVILSRWLFIPLVILALTGVYLSAEKFDLLPDTSIHHEHTGATDRTERFHSVLEIPFFKSTMLDQVRSIEFPFSEDPEEYYQIALQDREIKVNQETGTIVSSASYPFVALASRWSWLLHTGEGNVLWSLILMLASASILFFMYSGVVMTLKRLKKVKASSKMPDKDQCEIILLVGSETGTAFDFSKRLYENLSALGKSVYLTELNNYTTFATAKHIIILTSTYGDGEPPTNARKFEAVFPKIEQPHQIQYAVVGFGSLDYPDFCKFALKLDALLQINDGFQPLLPLCKINNADVNLFKDWSQTLGQMLQLSLHLELSTIQTKTRKRMPFEVLERTELNVDNTFLLLLKSEKDVDFESGDLLAIFPDDTETFRQYSIAKMGNALLLSIKKHEFGRGSSYLYHLKAGDLLNAAIDLNPDFHFPRAATSAVLIANGTGIAPFLGMIEQHHGTEIHLFWGGKTASSSKIYDAILKDTLDHTQTVTVHKSYSREGETQYVQHLVAKQKELLLHTVIEGGVIMICGSLAMQHGVLDVLEHLLLEYPYFSLEALEENGQLMMDCY